jgi:hypothetical protein
MKKFLGAGLFALALAATSTVASAATACSSLSPNNLIVGSSGAIGGNGTVVCSIGSLTFSNFSYNVDIVGAGQPLPPTVSVTIAQVINGIVDLEFNPGLASGSDLELEFQVTGGVSGVQLNYNGGAGTGINEEVCKTFTLTGICSGPSDFLAQLTVTPGVQNATATFTSAQSSIWVYKDISMVSGFFSEVNQGYVVPEPMTFSLLGAGLLGLGLMGRRRASK